MYARPSFWERVYLLWVFRNFHCLPREVLGLHQRRLIDKLCQAAVRQQSIAQTDIIGIVENVQLAPKRKADVAVTTSNRSRWSAPLRRSAFREPWLQEERRCDGILRRTEVTLLG